MTGKRSPSKDEIETAIRHAVIKFEQEFLGHGPEDVRAFIAKDVVMVRLDEVQTLAERQLTRTPAGSELVRQIGSTLITQGREWLCRQIDEITGARTIGLFTDIDTQLGERIIVLTLDRDLESVLAKRGTSDV